MAKVITILGGNGYIGRRCINKVLELSNDVQIKVVSRSGKIDSGKVYKFDERVQFVKGDCLNPSSFEQIINDSTGIIHSIGTLISSKPDNDPLSYNMMNKESCLRVAKIANESKIKKLNFVYISSASGLPFPLSLKFGGYIKTKKECEEELKKLTNINTIILKPGFVVDANDRVWSLPLKYQVDILNAFDNVILKKISTSLSETLLLPAKSIQLEVLAEYAAQGALGNLENRIYPNDEMIENCKNFKRH